MAGNLMTQLLDSNVQVTAVVKPSGTYLALHVELLPKQRHDAERYQHCGYSVDDRVRSSAEGDGRRKSHGDVRGEEVSTFQPLDVFHAVTDQLFGPLHFS